MRISVFETQYTAFGVRHATIRSRPLSVKSSYVRPPLRRRSEGSSRIGGYFQVVPSIP